MDMKQIIKLSKDDDQDLKFSSVHKMETISDWEKLNEYYSSLKKDEEERSVNCTSNEVVAYCVYDLRAEIFIW